MEVLETSAFWFGLLKIIWVNILLSGDNAVVIALAARSLPERQQKLAIIWGSAAAIVMRVLLTLFAAQLLELQWLKLIGAALLVYIGVQLLGEDDEGESHVKEGSTVLGAIKTILLADLVMSLDNVMGVAGAAEGAGSQAVKDVLIIVGLGLSIPIVIFGSNIVLKIMERFPLIVTLGGMLLGWIAGEMAVKEVFVVELLGNVPHIDYIFAVVGALLVLAIAQLLKAWGARHAEKDAGLKG